jgi:nitric oxide reductase subunit B
VTAAHGHLAFFGAYVMLNLALITYAMPYLRARAPYHQGLNILSFWIMTGAMTVMTFALTFAGAIQVHLQRVLGMSYMEVQDQIAPFYWVRLGSGVLVAIAAGLFLWSVFGPVGEKKAARIGAVQPAE